ncbi:MAG: hypothetical protein R6X33_03285 [Candidatus Brocadiia bacterium]
MPKNALSLQEFQEQIETLFGQRLTGPAQVAAKDFWEHCEGFTRLISQRKLSVQVDPLFLAHNFSEYARYHRWKGVGIISLIVGFVLVWFWWSLGVGLLVTAIALWTYSNRVRFNDAKMFAEQLMKDATLKPMQNGYARLCANYIAGIIQLSTPIYSARWPQHPSNVITGEKTFIDTEQNEQSD